MRVEHPDSAFGTPAFNVYGYDSLAQVTSANRFSGGTLAAPTDPVPGQQFGFAYDTIGNRKTATDGNATTAYTANTLNQYTSVNATVPTYDLDGNLLTDGTHTCEWDGENRLIKVTSGGTVIVNTYDALSRRVRRKVTSGTVTSDTGYVYDGWNVIAEYNLASGTPALTAVNTWGLDLSNSRQGAGGVGGLLTRTSGGTTHSYTFDGNGNVSELVTNAGSVAGHYEYGPFGQTTVQTDSDATGAVASNPYRFSTKPLDLGSGLYYYGYRYYNPLDGRWVNRDPIEEQGGANLYGFVANNQLIYVDSLGLILSSAPTISSLPIAIVDKLVLPHRNAETKVDWTQDIAQLEKAGEQWAVKINGSLILSMYALRSTHLDWTNPIDGRTTEEHERHHCELYSKWWSENKQSADPIEGKYCNIKCAQIAVDVANAINKLTENSAIAENTSFDLTVYPSTSPAIPQLQADYRHAVQQVNKWNTKLNQLEKKWRQSKCSKSE